MKEEYFKFVYKMPSLLLHLSKVFSQLNFNPLLLGVLFLYPLKTSENLWFSDILRGIQLGNILLSLLFTVQFLPFCYFHKKSHDRFLTEFKRCRGGCRAGATSKMEYFVIIVNGFQHSILDVAAALDRYLRCLQFFLALIQKCFNSSHICWK